MLFGGLISGRPYLIIGGAGSGKTILGMQFLLKGIEQGESGLYITLDEPSDELRENMETFGWDTSAIRILDITPDSETTGEDLFGVRQLRTELKNEIETYGHLRLVLDSTTTIRMVEESAIKVRRRILTLMKFLSSYDITALFICEWDDARMNIESFLARGVLRMHKLEKRGEKIRAISIEKMRGTAFDEQIRPMAITDEGIMVYSDEAAFETFD